MADIKVVDEDLIPLFAQGLGNNEIGRLVGVNESTIRYRRKRLAAMGLAPECGLTKRIPEGYELKGSSTLYGTDGSITSQWVKTTRSIGSKEEDLKNLKEAFIEDLPKVLAVSCMNEHLINESLMAVYPLGDPHVGMLAWAEETQENWDLAIAEKILCSSFSRMVSKAPRCKEGVILNLGDFFHYDNLSGVTEAHKNVLDRDGRYAKMVKVGIKIIRQMIETALSHHSTVRVINCVGNHDETGSLFLSLCLSHIYDNEPRVIVDTSPTPFHYIKFGSCLIGAHHGHTCKIPSLAGIMAADRAKDWGDTKYRYWMTGHIHNESKQEFPGCLVESFRTMAAQDSYAAWHGYRSGRDSKVIVFHKDYGEIERYTVSIDQLI